MWIRAGSGNRVTIVRAPSGRYVAKLKSGREYVGSKTFDTKGQAAAWLARERAAMAGGVDPRAGRQRVRCLLTEWIAVRDVTVAKKTCRADRDLLRLMPTTIQALQISAVSPREVQRSFETLLASGLADSSVIRYRASLSSFFTWCAQNRVIATNPVAGTKVPRSSAEKVGIQPWSESELERVYLRWHQAAPHVAELLLLLAWTGLRWGEARALTVADVMTDPTPGLLVRRSAPEGVPTKSTKSRRSRRVPVPNRVLATVYRLAQGKQPHELLMTTERGSRLHRSAVLRTVNWQQTSDGRRLHDLRHTAACLWLARGVDPSTVQHWMGHESIATTTRYLHHLGTAADAAGLDRLNANLEYGRDTCEELDQSVTQRERSVRW